MNLQSCKSVALIAVLASLSVFSHAQDSCEQLKKVSLDSTTIESAENISAGSFKLPPAPAFAPDTSKMPAFCRVKGTIHPAKDSEIEFEVWLPAQNWSGRFVQLGNGGLAGSINYAPLVGEVIRHNATAATDDGHHSSGIDGSWAIGHPEKVKDFGYRAVHETSDVAKKVIAAFYGSPAKYSYFNGCSEGGREALIEAQRYPKDFNGILVGAPGHYWIPLLTAFAWNAQALTRPESFISEAKRRIIEDAALAACGTQDGVKDSFIQNPLACHFDPDSLLCKGQDTEQCLTRPELEALKKIYAGPKNPRTGAQITPGYEPGAEAEPGLPGLAYSSYIYGTAPGMSLDAMFSTAFFGNFVFDNPAWKYTELNFDSDVTKADAKLGAILDASDPNLKPLEEAGGKLLHYHGWYDGSPSPLQSIDYYDRVETVMGGGEATQKFYRLFMAPGMMHCGTGPGPNAFGNLTDLAPSTDPERNIFVALEQWVEKGIAPDKIIATKYKGDDPSKGVELTRPLCPYPATARYVGSGLSSDAANWRCQAPTTKSFRALSPTKNRRKEK